MEALRRVHERLTKVSSLLTECGDAINLRSRSVPVDTALAAFADKSAEAQEIVVGLLRSLPSEIIRSSQR
jgi:hypothetical protein